MAQILITGFGGGLAQRVAELLLDEGHQVRGVDYRPVRPLTGRLAEVPIHQANYNKTAIEDVFRHHPPEVVLHLGRVGNLKESLNKRFDLNVVGSQKIMNLCAQHRVRRLMVLSTFHIYGADPLNHTPIYEEDPVRAGTEFPQLADAIQLDNLATTWVYQHPQCRVVVLRPTNVVGPTIRNAMSNFLRLPTVPHLFGFNPMSQFLHESDLAAAVVAAAHSEATGIFNLAGPDPAPWLTALDLVRAATYPLPSSLTSLFVRAFSRFPAYLVKFFKYPCVISDQRFRDTFRWQSRVSLPTTLWTTVAEARARQVPRL